MMWVKSWLGKWQTYCVDVASNRSIVMWTDNDEQPISKDVKGQLIWLPVVANTSKIEVAGNSAIFTGMTAFRLQSPSLSYPPSNFTASIIFGWNITQWSINRSYVKQVRKQTVSTREKAYYDLLSPLMMTFNQSVSICHRFGGQLPDFPSLTSWQSAYDAHLDSQPDTMLWLPYIKETAANNGTVTDFYTGKYLGIAGNIPWLQGQPSLPDSSCVLCSRSGCGDYLCTETAFFFCRIPVEGVGRPLLYLRGLCAQTGLDTIYYPQLLPQSAANDSVLDLVWTGLSGGTYIRYNSSVLMWEARRAGWSVAATSTASLKSLLLGTKQWNIDSDTDCPSSSLQLLSLVSCTEDQFNCEDGSCIDLKYR
jgi:hypothetical protein